MLGYVSCGLCNITVGRLAKDSSSCCQEEMERSWRTPVSGGNIAALFGSPSSASGGRKLSSLAQNVTQVDSNVRNPAGQIRADL